jgi:hypothetical protein
MVCSSRHSIGFFWDTSDSVSLKPIAALLTQRNIEEAAKSIGIGVQTMLRWLDPEFEQAYREAQRPRAIFRKTLLNEPSSTAQEVAGRENL